MRGLIEHITENKKDQIVYERIKTPQGWIVGMFVSNLPHLPNSVSVCFVPDPNHEWILEEEKPKD